MKIAFVIPTLGNDTASLKRTLFSISNLAFDSIAVIITKSDSLALQTLVKEFDTYLLIEESDGLYLAMNQGVAAVVDECEYYVFLGDDDTLDKQGFEKLYAAAIRSRPAVVYGGIRYVDDSGETIMCNYSFPGLARFLVWIPNLIPHPGSLINVPVWCEVDGYDEKYKLASDLDFWLKVRRFGRFQYKRVISANFRFSINTLTGGARDLSLSESTSIRKHHVSIKGKFLHNAWSPMLQWLGEYFLRQNLKRNTKFE